MDRDRDHVWVVQRDRDSTLIPIAYEEVAENFREDGWLVTELPLSALTQVGLRCLGIKLKVPPGA